MREHRNGSKLNEPYEDARYSVNETRTREIETFSLQARTTTFDTVLLSRFRLFENELARGERGLLSRCVRDLSFTFFFFSFVTYLFTDTSRYTEIRAYIFMYS